MISAGAALAMLALGAAGLILLGARALLVTAGCGGIVAGSAGWMI
jgi:hypothetical protein